MKALPGRKTDVNDAGWSTQLLRHGLLKASFIPNRIQREIRELVHYRRSIIEERARQHKRIQKVLEGSNIKLGSVVSDIMGISSKDMLYAITDGEEDRDWGSKSGHHRSMDIPTSASRLTEGFVVE
jgi:transposase